jgi:hypothetical protein
MPELDDTIPIGDDELVFRRVPVSMNWYGESAGLSPLAFRPRDNDETGLSVVRGEPYNTLAEAARGPSKKGYFIAVLRAGDLRKQGLVVEPKPIAGVSGHAEITSLTRANRATDEAKSMMVKMAHELCLRVDGPFENPV